MGDGGYYQPEQRIPETPYICVRVIGEGGFGVVYAVRHYYTEQRFALKTLHAFLTDRQDLAVRMRNEAKFLARIRHPNVVPVIDGGITGDGRPFLVMEFLNGEPLSQTLADLPRGLGTKGMLRLVELLDGLEVVHRKGAVHRDIKPANVFLQSAADEVTGSVEWRPILLDFGVSHFMRNEKPITGQMFLGTMRYSAPEQIRGETPTPKTDLYSLGLVFYECLCGHGPFDDLGKEDAIARAHLSQEPPHLSSVLRSVDQELAEFIMQMLAKDPAKRPQSAVWLANAFRELRIRLLEHDVTAADANRTEPTPLDNRFITLSVPLTDRGPDRPAAAAGPSTAPAAPHAIRVLALNDTVPDALPPFPVVTTIEDKLPMGGARTLLAERHDAQRDQPTAHGEPGVDRIAPTRTMDPFRAPKPTHDTEPIPAALQADGQLAEDNVYMPGLSEAVWAEPPSMPPGPLALRPGSMLRAAPVYGPPGFGPRGSGGASSAAGVAVSSESRRRPRRRPWQERAAMLGAAMVTVAVLVVAGFAVLHASRRAPAAASSSIATTAALPPAIASILPELPATAAPPPPASSPPAAAQPVQGVTATTAPPPPPRPHPTPKPVPPTRNNLPGPGF